MKTSERREKGTPMNTRKTANAVVRHLEATTPVYDVSEQGFDVRQVHCSRTLDAEPRVRGDVGGWAR